MVRVPGGRFELGEDSEEHRPPVRGASVPWGWFTLQAFCVAEYPFPGLPGAAWPLDGLNHAGALRLEREVAAYGRRLCSASELLLATAGPENARFFYGAERAEGRCEDDEEHPGPLGSHPGCANGLGVKRHPGRPAGDWAAELSRFRRSNRFGDWLGLDP